MRLNRLASIVAAARAERAGGPGGAVMCRREPVRDQNILLTSELARKAPQRLKASDKERREAAAASPFLPHPRLPKTYARFSEMRNEAGRAGDASPRCRPLSTSKVAARATENCICG